MAGGIRKDPAIERWAMMRDNTHLYFRLTPLTAIAGLIGLVAVPVGLYYGIKKGEVPPDNRRVLQCVHCLIIMT